MSDQMRGARPGMVPVGASLKNLFFCRRCICSIVSVCLTHTHTRTSSRTRNLSANHQSRRWVPPCEINSSEETWSWGPEWNK